MKKGIIVYVPANAGIDKNCDLEDAARSLQLDAEKVELVSERAGHLNVMDAWRHLISQGAGRISCVIGDVQEGSKIILAGKEMSLWG
jgi:hypothetical protein